MAEPTPNTLIDDRYKVMSRLGSGGMADVFLVEDQQLGRKVALKLLHGRFAADPDFVERFRREAQAAAGLQHPNVVGIYDRGRYDDTYYIAMEYLPGRSLKQLIRQEAPLDPVRAIEITIQILKAARFAHRRGVIHRDLKPHNVIIDDADQAKVTDFGIARAGASDMTETGSIMGTAQYLSPEQAQGHSVNATSDLYSIGVVLYEMLTGRVPFDGESPVTIALKHVSEAPVPPSELNPNVPPELEQVVLWSLNKNPADRPADADQFITALEDCKAAIRAGSGGQHTTSMAAVIAAAAGGAGAGAAGAALAGAAGAPEAGYADSATNGSGELGGPVGAEEGDEHRHNWRPWLWALLVALLIAGAATGAYFLSRPHKRVVPPVTGEQLNVARTVLQNAGFAVGVIQVPSKQAAGNVIGENPAAGIKADKGSTVTLTVSQGPGEQAVPSVQGLSQGKATKLIKGAHLKVSRVIMQSSSRFDAGQATGTDPGAGTSVPFGTGVTLFVSSGPPSKAVPDVTGQSQSDATSALTADGFKVNTETQTSSSAQPGNVISQDPSGGSSSAPGSTVTIVIAAAPSTTTVPPVVGDPADGATSALLAAGFKVQRKTTNVSSQNQNGTVVSQSPSGGSTAKKNSTVTITIGQFTRSSSSTTTTSSTPSSSSSTTTSTTSSKAKKK
ncbi:MAG TPA: Stk1 family PASTA domain-containing Ser/Thr kinase [Solirubrobacteraceae bacterium]